MLANDFTMASARHVRVRYRFFHSQQDYERFAREVSCIAEPMTLAISSHGSRKGGSFDGKTLHAKFVATALRDAGYVELLHLSGCDMMSGEMPAEIHAHLSGEASLPESGYRETGAWDASAVSDFVYLSLVLIRGLDSSAAIKQSHLAAPFTDKDKVAGSAFAPMGLTETEPE